VREAGFDQHRLQPDTQWCVTRPALLRAQAARREQSETEAERGRAPIHGAHLTGGTRLARLGTDRALAAKRGGMKPFRICISTPEARQ
jgi:hypothetical protein